HGGRYAGPRALECAFGIAGLALFVTQGQQGIHAFIFDCVGPMDGVNVRDAVKVQRPVGKFHQLVRICADSTSFPHTCISCFTWALKASPVVPSISTPSEVKVSLNDLLRMILLMAVLSF